MKYKSKYQWKFAKVDKVLARKIAGELNISEILATILVNRGIGNEKEALDFMNPHISTMHSPYLMKDMDKAVNRFIEAVENKEKVLFYSDYDADGVTSIAILIKLSRLLGIDYKWYHPDRNRLGYGFHKKGVDCAKEGKASLI